jgi:hypothetical protein
MASEIHEGDIGTKLLVTVVDDGVVVDIGPATTLEMFIKKPNGTILSRTGVLETDGSDGQMYYITVSGDIDAAGTYKLQGRVVLPGGSYYTSTATFKVHCNL